MTQRKEMHLYIFRLKTSSLQSSIDDRFWENIYYGIRRRETCIRVRGIQPEWFWKGNGNILRGHNGYLDIPSFTEDGGEEPEIFGCYIIDEEVGISFVKDDM
jgi:hypothetical protein